MKEWNGLHRWDSLFVKMGSLMVSVAQATRLSFRELYQELEEYIDDPQRRWEECLRVKRGLCDTSQPGAFCKDQVWQSLSFFGFFLGGKRMKHVPTGTL